MFQSLPVTVKKEEVLAHSHKGFGQYKSQLVKKDVYSEAVGGGEACS